MWKISVFLFTSIALAYDTHNTTAAKPFTGGSKCCSLLQAHPATIPKRLVAFRNSSEFKNQQSGAQGYWTQQEASVIPQCRFTPTCAEDVSNAVSILAHSNCQFAIRGGGHMSWAGAANIQDGVTIDLGQMKSVNVSSNRKVTQVGPGARWHDVYSKLDSMGLSVVGGRVSDVGVAGLTIGGGNSFFAAQYGFACDNVLNFQLVLASGAIINVNARSHSQLFKALKGGSNNFGIVTRFDFATFEQGQLWGGFIVYPFSTAPSQLQALQNFTTASGKGEDPYASVINAYIFGPNGPEAVANQYTYTKAQAYPEILGQFTDIQPHVSNSMRITNLTNITDEVGAPTPNGYRQLFGTATFTNNPTLLAKVLEIAQDAFRPISNVTDFQASVVFQPISKAIMSKGTAKGGNVLGLDGKEDLIFLDLTVQWSHSTSDIQVTSAAETFLRQSISAAQSSKSSHPFIYLNYALQSQDPIASYGAKNHEFLRRTARRYDPHGVFQSLVPGGFKLWREDATCCG